MHDVLVHYLEVNFPEIAEQLAHARTREPGNEERAAAAERLRELIRRLRRGAVESGAAWHEPRASAAEMIAGVNGELSPDERAVLDHFFELFARSMERTQAAKPSEPAQAEAQPEPVAVTPVAEPAAAEAPAAEAQTEPEPESVVVPAVEEAPAQTAQDAQEATAEAAPMAPEPPASRLVPEQMAGYLQTILLAAAQQALDLLQVDASQVYTLGEQRRFVLRAGVPTESLAAPEGVASISSGLLGRALEHNEVFTVEDLVAAEAVTALRAHSLASRVAEVAVLQERLNLAREIHDGLASDLAAVVALFKYYEQRRERDPDDAGQLLPQLRSMTEEILAGARNILQSLRPKTIRSEGLLASLLKLVDQFGRVNLVETNVNIRGEENAIPAEQKEVIFQVLRESLSNVRKHSRARNLWVVLDLSSAPWVMTVRDDGRGFDVRRVAEDPRKVGSYGLVGMRERAELMGGTLEIVSQTLEGTVVTLIGPAERAE